MQSSSAQSIFVGIYETYDPCLVRYRSLYSASVILVLDDSISFFITGN